jgi:hypothetical protein
VYRRCEREKNIKHIVSEKSLSLIEEAEVYTDYIEGVDGKMKVERRRHDVRVQVDCG